MNQSNRKILSPEALAQLREGLRREGRTVVQCHGCFDIVHPGHIRYLRFAAEQGDVLVVSISADDVVGKGARRPYVPEELRAENLAALEMIDYVCIDSNTWAGPILEALRPDVYVKGKEYEEKNDARFAKERELVESYGGQVIFSSGDVIFSSTQIGDRFVEEYNLEPSKVRAYCRRNGIDREGVTSAIKSIGRVRLAVIGDAIIDEYLHCETTGLAAEAPVLSLTATGHTTYVGGVGLIALQAAALGATVRFITAVSRGSETERLEAACEDAGVELVIVEAERRPVGRKRRYLVEERKVLKVDTGRPGPLPTVTQAALIAEVARAFDDCDGVVASDFGFGTFGAPTIDALASSSERTKRPLFVDVSKSGDANILRFRGARLATPTEEELRFAFGDHSSGLSNLAARFYAATGVARLAVTMGRRGVVLFGPESDLKEGSLSTEYLPSLATRVVDPVGAGDVFLAALSSCDLAGIPLTTGAYMASAVAGAHLQRLGNAPVSLNRLEWMLESRSELW